MTAFLLAGCCVICRKDIKYKNNPLILSFAGPNIFAPRHDYLTHDLSVENAPKLIVLIDVQTFYDMVVHDWMIANIPMDKTILKKFLKAGMIRDGELFPTDKGISMASGLSPKLANMMLDGLQSNIYDRLYPNGGRGL